jgi:hypothetical protein
MALELNNLALCYHGMTSNINEKSNYVTYIEDFKEQISHLETLGYNFVKPSVFYMWYQSLTQSPLPLATIIFDDALNSLGMAASWLEGRSIPYGVAVIGQRLCKLKPEEGYISWQELQTAVAGGLCEILHHTYNMHHMCLIKEENEIVTAPILEGPCYVDHGNFIYITQEDTRWYFDMSHINNTSWGFPLFGTDQNTNQMITSTVIFKANTTVLADRLRVWACLHNPYGSGYNVQIQIKINGSIVADSVINPVNYTTRTQWPEREFVTIPFTNSFQILQGNSYTIEFNTLNTGNASFLIYAVPDFSGDFTLTTTCTGMTFSENVPWPARACIILADGTGSTATSSQYQSYIQEDLDRNNQVIQKYLNAAWSTRSTGYEDTDMLSTLVLGGTYANGQLADTKIKYHANETFTADILRVKYASRMGNRYPLIIDVYINDLKVGRFESNWWEWHWQEIEIEEYNFVSGNDYTIRFVTKSASPYGQGLVRLYMDQPGSPRPVWSEELNSFVALPDSEFAHTALYEVVNTEGTDVYPDGVVIDNSINYHYIINEPYDGPGKAFLEILSCSSGAVEVPTQICYPFGSYYSVITSEQKEDVHSDLKNVLNGAGINSGYSVWDNPIGSLDNIQLQYSEYLIPRYLIEGITEQSQVIDNIDTFIGYK